MKPKIAIFQKDLTMGGIQKSLINLLNTIDLKKYDIDLYLFSRDNFYEASLPKEITIIYREHQDRIARFIPFNIYYLLKKVSINKQYDLSIDFNGYQNITAAYALKVHASKRFYWIHSDLYIRRTSQRSKALKLIHSLLLTLTRNKWRRFDGFIGVSDGVLESFKTDFPSKVFTTIQNIIDTKEIIEKSQEPVDDLDFSSSPLNIGILGRLDYVKGIDLFLLRLSNIVKQRQDIHIYVIGDGPERQKLENMVHESNLDNHVTFLGAKKNPYKYLAKMDGLVLYSRYEGQGMVLMEAKALGLPIYFPKRLEKYNDRLTGTDDIVSTLVSAEKISNRAFNKLTEYNKSIVKKIDTLFSGK